MPPDYTALILASLRHRGIPYEEAQVWARQIGTAMGEAKARGAGMERLSEIGTAKMWDVAQIYRFTEEIPGAYFP